MKTIVFFLTCKQVSCEVEGVLVRGEVESDGGGGEDGEDNGEGPASGAKPQLLQTDSTQIASHAAYAAERASNNNIQYLLTIHY